MNSYPIGDQSLTKAQIKEAEEFLNRQKEVIQNHIHLTEITSLDGLQSIDKQMKENEGDKQREKLEIKPRPNEEISQIPPNKKLNKALESGSSKIKFKTPPNPQKCIFSPYSFHRFARAHKEKLKDGTIAMILRCRYCIEFQQVLIRFEKDKNGRYVARKEVMPVNETIQNGSQSSIDMK